MIWKEFNRMDKFIDKDHDYVLPAEKLKLVSHEATCKIHLGKIKAVTKMSFSLWCFPSSLCTVRRTWSSIDIHFDSIMSLLGKWVFTVHIFSVSPHSVFKTSYSPISFTRRSKKAGAEISSILAAMKQNMNRLYSVDTCSPEAVSHLSSSRHMIFYSLLICL